MVGGELVLSYSMKMAGLQNDIFYYTHAGCPRGQALNNLRRSMNLT